MEAHTVKFIKSSPDLKACPVSDLPEYALAGRSNVGKSSLLNLLINLKNLAKTSSTPGKTRLINHYLINENWYMVDLPGYGYAKTGKKTREFFLETVGDYLLHRDTMVCLFILIDSRHRPLKSDLEFIEWSGINHIPLALIFTKTDKLSSTSLIKNMDFYRNTLLQSWEELPPVFTTSALRREGREELLAFIEKSNALFNGK